MRHLEAYRQDFVTRAFCRFLGYSLLLIGAHLTGTPTANYRLKASLWLAVVAVFSTKAERARFGFQN